MDTILKIGFFLFLLITFFDGHSNFIIDLRHNNGNDFNETNVKNNNSKIENPFDINDLYDNLPNMITTEQRIDYCKQIFPNYDYNRLDSSDKDLLRQYSNLCRVDCVVFDKNENTGTETKTYYTIYFKDGTTKCNPGKVCLPLKEDKDAGICVIDPNLSSTTTPPSTTSTLPTTPTLPTVQTSTPTSTLTTNTKLSDPSSEKLEVPPSTTTQSPTTSTSTLPPQTTPPSELSTPQRKDCLVEGYFRDLNDPSCRRFYRCYPLGNDYKKVDVGVCPPGTVFDDTLSSCQYYYLINEPCPTAN